MKLLPKLNLRSALKRKESKGGNPIQHDPDLIELMEWLDMITTYEVFNQWRNQFLDRYQEYMRETGNDQAEEAYANFGIKVQKLVQSVARVARDINEGKITSKKIAVRARNSLSEISRDCQIINIELFGLAPTTATEENLVGYNKYQMGVVLIRNHFEEYERLDMCKDIMQALRDRVLDGVVDRQILQSIDDYDRAINRFFSLMQDLGFHRIMVKSKELHPLTPPKEIMDEIQGPELQSDLTLQDLFGSSSRRQEGPPPKARSMLQDSSHTPEGKKAEKPRKAKSLAGIADNNNNANNNSNNKEVKGKSKDLDGSRSKRSKSKDPKKDGGTRRGLKKSDRQDSSDSLYVEDERTQDQPNMATQFRNPKSVRKVSPADVDKNSTLSPKHMKRRASTGGAAGDDQKDTDSGPRARKSSAELGTSHHRKGKNGSMGQKDMGKLSNQIGAESDGAENVECAPQTAGLTADGTPKRTAGLVMMEPKNSRGRKKNGWKGKHDDDDGNRSVVSISSKKKAKLKAVQVKKSKLEVKKGFRDKKLRAGDKKAKASQGLPGEATTNSNENKHDEVSGTESHGGTTDKVPGEVSGVTPKKKAAKGKKLTSMADFFSQEKQLRGEGDGGNSVSSGKRSVASDPQIRRVDTLKRDISDTSSLKLPLPSTLNSGLPKSQRNHSGGSNSKDANTNSKVPVRQEKESNSARGAQGSVDKKPARAQFQWPPPRPNNIDNSASRLTDKWTPPLPVAQPTNTPVQENNDKKRTGRDAQSRPGKTVIPKKWPSSLLDKTQSIDDAEADEDFMLNGPTQDESETFAELCASFSKLENGSLPMPAKAEQNGNVEQNGLTVNSADTAKSSHSANASQQDEKNEDDGEDFSFATLHKNFLIEHKSPSSVTKSPVKVGKLDTLALALSPDGSNSSSSRSILDQVFERKWHSSVRGFGGGDSDDDVEVVPAEEKATTNDDTESRTESPLKSPSVQKPSSLRDFVDKRTLDAPRTVGRAASLDDLRNSFSNLDMSVGGDETELNGNDELFSGIDLQEFDDTDSKELNGSASLEEFEINGDDFLTVPFDTSNGKDYSLEHLRKSIANLSPLDAQESKMSDTTGEVESSANRVEAKLDNKKNYGDSHHSTLPVSNSDKETDVPVPPAFALMQSQNRPKAPKIGSLAPKGSKLATPAVRKAWNKPSSYGGKVHDNSVPPVFKRPTSKPLLKKKSDSFSYSGGISKPRSPGGLKDRKGVLSRINKNAGSSSGSDDDEGGNGSVDNDTTGITTQKPKSLKLADLIADDDDEGGGLFFDGSFHTRGSQDYAGNIRGTGSVSTPNKFRPISQWASIADQDDNRSRASVSKRRAAANKKRAPVVSASKKVGKNKAERSKPVVCADDSSVVKIKKNVVRKKGEVTYEKTVDKRKRKPKAKEVGNGNGEKLTGWVNPFDVGAGEHHYEIGTC